MSKGETGKHLEAQEYDQREPEPKTSDGGPGPTRTSQKGPEDCAEPVFSSWYHVALRYMATVNRFDFSVLSPPGFEAGSTLHRTEPVPILGGGGVKERKHL